MMFNTISTKQLFSCLIIFICLFLFNSSLFAADKCVSGNCVNGQGMKIIDFFSSGFAKYEGGFKNGKFDGQGTYTFNLANSVEKPSYVPICKSYPATAEQIKYSVEWKNGLKEYVDQKYVGGWKDGAYEGQGTAFQITGDKYEGEWKGVNGYDGKGTIFCANGDKYEGEWDAFEFNGLGIYTYANGTEDIGLWKRGVLVTRGTKKILDVKLDSQLKAKIIKESPVYKVPKGQEQQVEDSLKIVHTVTSTDESKLDSSVKTNWFFIQAGIRKEVQNSTSKSDATESEVKRSVKIIGDGQAVKVVWRELYRTGISKVEINGKTTNIPFEYKEDFDLALVTVN